MMLTVFIGCFNERETILKAIEEAKSINIDKEIIVIDNCSTDGTKEILKKLKQDEFFKIIFHSKNMGAGYSAQEAIKLARGKYFYGPGADLEYKMSDVYRMIEKAERENLDAVLGSRLLDKKNISKIKLIKERPYWLGTFIATSLINFLYGKNFTDVIGIHLVKTEVLRELNCSFRGQAFTFEEVSKLCKRKYQIGEVSISYTPRTRKEGKTIKAIDIFPAIWAILKVRFWDK